MLPLPSARSRSSWLLLLKECGEGLREYFRLSRRGDEDMASTGRADGNSSNDDGDEKRGGWLC